jgi:hypothetical protein
MSAVPVGRASYRWLTITLLVAGGVYAWYAIGQYNRLNDLYQRQLSNAGTDLKVALDNAVETVKQFNDKWNKSTEENRPRVCDFVRSQPYLERDDAQRALLRTTSSGRSSRMPRRWWLRHLESGLVARATASNGFDTALTDWCRNWHSLNRSR